FARAFVLSIATLITASPFLPTIVAAMPSNCELGRQECQSECGCQKGSTPRKCSGCCEIPVPVESNPPLPDTSQRVWLDWQIVTAERSFAAALHAAKPLLGATLTRQSSIQIVTSSAP